MTYPERLRRLQIDPLDEEAKILAPAALAKDFGVDYVTVALGCGGCYGEAKREN